MTGFSSGIGLSSGKRLTRLTGLSAGPGLSHSGKPVNVASPLVNGTPLVGQILFCSTGTWSGAVSYTYQWFSTVDGAIVGATNNLYTITAAESGESIYCRVTASNPVGTTFADSNALGPIP